LVIPGTKSGVAK
jgi:hypothetical protein